MTKSLIQGLLPHHGINGVINVRDIRISTLEGVQSAKRGNAEMINKECPECKGSVEQGFTVCGTVKYPIIVPNECPTCSGTGKQPEYTACLKCGGMNPTGLCESTTEYKPVKFCTCNWTGKQPEDKLTIFNLKDRQVDIDPDIAEITPKIVDELLFGKQSEAPMEYECLSCPILIKDGEYCSECSDTKDGRLQKKEVKR